MRTTALLLCCLALWACRDDRTDAQASAPPAPAVAELPDDFEGTWRGVLPCSDCQGIDTAVALVRDGDTRRYSMQEAYLGVPGEPLRSEGDWREEAAEIDGRSATVVVLEASGQRWWRREDGDLVAVDGNNRPLAEEDAVRLQRL